LKFNEFNQENNNNNNNNVINRPLVYDSQMGNFENAFNSFLSGDQNSQSSSSSSLLFSNNVNNNAYGWLMNNLELVSLSNHKVEI
jgi:hypothetical protein